jgi:hypothetical protein
MANSTQTARTPASKVTGGPAYADFAPPLSEDIRAIGYAEVAVMPETGVTEIPSRIK